MVPDLGVDLVGEIDRGGPRGKDLQFPFRREEINFVLVQVQFEALHELLRRDLSLRRVLENLPHPDHPVLQLLIDRGGVLLVHPVGGDPPLGDLVHPPRADLHLHHLAVRAHHGRVDRLVAVLFRDGDVVLEPLRVGNINVGDQPVDFEAVVVVLRFEDEAYREQVVDLLQRLVPLEHLVVDRIEMLGPAADLEFESRFLQPLLDGRREFPDIVLALAPPRLEIPRQGVVGFPVQVLESKVLQLPLYVRQAEPVGKRGVDVERLLCHPFLLFRGEVFERPHVVKPVGELHEHDADVVDHRQEHLPVALGLGHVVALEDVGDLRRTVDDFRDRVPELLPDVVDRVLGVLRDVVHQRDGDGHVVERDLLGDDLCDFIRMVEKRLSGGPEIVAVGVEAEFERAADQALIHFREVLLTDDQKILELLFVLEIRHRWMRTNEHFRGTERFRLTGTCPPENISGWGGIVKKPAWSAVFAPKCVVINDGAALRHAKKRRAFQ